MLQAHEEYLCLAKKSALDLKSLLSKLSMSLEKEIARKKDVVEYASEAGLSKADLQKEKENLAFLESIYPTQLYCQLTKWIKAQEKFKNGTRKKRKRRRNNRPG